MRKLIIMPDINHIQLFKTAGICKASNAQDNKVRENIIANMFNLDDEYFNDPIYGTDWKTFQQKFITSVSTLYTEPFHKICINPAGGMSNNYDFKLSFRDNNNKILNNIKLEFKHNNNEVVNLCQFLELYDKDCKNKYDMFQNCFSYSEFYYDNYLLKYLKIENITELPDKESWLKNVSDIKYNHPFFKMLHEKKNNQVEKKKAIANESVTEYLNLYLKKLNFDKIIEKKIKDSQIDKVFLLWDCENFHTEILDVKAITISEITKINDFCVKIGLNSFKYDICVRLRWANNNGLANPSWKFSFIHK